MTAILASASECEERIKRAVAAERLRWEHQNGLLEAEIKRLQELLRGVGANRYWEGRWRDERERSVKNCAEFVEALLEYLDAVRNG